MRIVIMGAVMAMFGVAAPSAQTPTAPAAKPPVAPAAVAPVGPPKGLPGYSQPEITAAYCRNISPTQTSCTLPAMTAGRYVVQATGTSTASGAGAAQALVIQVGDRTCGRADRKPVPPPNAWTAGAKTIALNCELVVMADRPLTVSALYADDKAVKDPKGPTLIITRAPWEGVLSVTPFAPPQQ
ncbi:hypothetical protein QO010_002508 [Caulobacter ginsengisoli]|uniref:Uncharacterized protein n=1 Tax=Caulobacter ginsengisoli TaxID=400775 RepID=A0ABU0IRU0_9CAUL|nr:hypothetical protein [Caulobacter ginsengisoli]MDQ0464724.1 hypothetical protein [Caulobacter ginsengisoli]